MGKKDGPRHISCPGTNSGYRVGGLFLEMEYCPFSHCAATFMDPEVTSPIKRRCIGLQRPGCARYAKLILLVRAVSPGTC